MSYRSRKDRKHRRRREQKIRFDKHHRKCKSNGGIDTPKNISIVPHHLHKYWHALFANFEAPTIASIINSIWLDPDWELVAVKKNNKPDV